MRLMTGGNFCRIRFFRWFLVSAKPMKVPSTGSLRLTVSKNLLIYWILLGRFRFTTCMEVVVGLELDVEARGGGQEQDLVIVVIGKPADELIRLPHRIR